MKKRKTAAFLAALMICAWVPQAVPGDSGVLVAEAHRPYRPVRRPPGQ